jgi:predicted AAA+ superfamily ATPase
MPDRYIERSEYLKKLLKWQIDSDIIKIVTGVRRCGKSVLFKLFQEHLLKTGIAQNRIQAIELDLDKNEKYRDRHALSKHIMDNLVPDKMNYIFLDEIQMVPDWQQTANSLRAEKNIDLYLTGSNAYMFSSELSTLLGGRYVEIKMQPFSFKEYFEGNKENSKKSPQDVYTKYITESSFPQTIKYAGDKELISDYLRDTVYRNTINKDIVQRFKLKDALRLDSVIQFLFDNISNETSILGIEQALQINGRGVSNDSISKYIDGLLDSYLLYKCERFDLKGKRILRSSPKYYVCDIGLRSVVLGRELGDTGRVLENVVYLELLRRGFDVYVGKIGKKQENGVIREIEVDFAATKANGVKEYYQVATSIMNEDVAAREIRSLEEIDDNYPKYILSMDPECGTHKGIKHLNVLDWLLW